jgi:polynucleotide 5'-kinase involved in rRNA processing
MLELPPEWEEALARAAAATRVAVLGPPDSRKPAFVAALAERRPECRIIDLDPGQKMIGRPGTASLGRVAGPGVWLQAMTLDSLRPELAVPGAAGWTLVERLVPAWEPG